MQSFYTIKVCPMDEAGRFGFKVLQGSKVKALSPGTFSSRWAADRAARTFLHNMRHSPVNLEVPPPKRPWKLPQ